MAKIKCLPREVSELIAAGEVIERPASIVKELMENAIDSKATRITVEIKNGGINYIRVTDNGCGIAEEDMPTAFIRHATSKVSTKEDLDSIMTMGFRGEALPSIAAVSKVTITSRIEGEIHGTKFRIQGADDGEIEDVGCPVGTTVVVRDLFYNLPARIKFLKKDVTEGNAVASIVERIVLANPHIGFTFVREGITKFSTSGDGQLLTVIRLIMGAEYPNSMIPVLWEDDHITVSGYIAKPAFSRANRTAQHFVINGRYVRSKTCTAALEEAYRLRLMGGRFPSCVLNIQLNPQNIDVNVHPAKLEVRFSDERVVYNGVYASCKNGLEESEQPHFTKQFNPFTLNAEEVKGNQTEFHNDEIIVETPPRIELYSPLTTVTKQEIPSSITTKIEDKYSNDIGNNIVKPFAFTDIKQEDYPENTPYKPVIPPSIREKEHKVSFTVIGELFGCYILCQTEKELLLIDKHATHERIIYNALSKNVDNTSRQLALFHHVVLLRGEDYRTIIENRDLVKQVGITFNDVGDGGIIVEEVAMVLSTFPLQRVLEEIATSIRQSAVELRPFILDEFLFSVSCRCAVMSGDKSSISDLTILAEEAMNGAAKHCPHGRPTTISMTKNEIERMFGRTM